MPGARKARHDRSDRDASDLRNILVGKLLQFAQTEAFSPLDRKRVERLVYLAERLSVHQCGLGAGARIGHVHNYSLLLSRAHSSAERNLHSRLLCLDVRVGDIADDLKHPPPYRATAKRSEGFQIAQKGVLYDVLGRTRHA